MPMSAAQRGLGRREFMSQALAFGGMAAVATFVPRTNPTRCDGGRLKNR